MATSTPRRIVKPATAIGRLARLMTRPGAPLTTARSLVQPGPAKRKPRAITSSAPRAVGMRHTPVEPQHHVRVEHRDQAREVALARGRQERLGHRPLLREVGVGGRRGRLHAAAGSARQLAGRERRATNDGRDLVEGHREEVVEHEGQPLGRYQRVQHDQQRQGDPIGKERQLLGVAVLGPAHQPVRHKGAQGRLTARGASAEHIQAIRATTVVSQPPRFMLLPASLRLSRAPAMGSSPNRG